MVATQGMRDERSLGIPWQTVQEITQKLKDQDNRDAVVRLLSTLDTRDVSHFANAACNYLLDPYLHGHMYLEK